MVGRGGESESEKFGQKLTQDPILFQSTKGDLPNFSRGKKCFRGRGELWGNSSAVLITANKNSTTYIKRTNS